MQGCAGPSTSAKLPSHPAWWGGARCPEHVCQPQQCLADTSNWGRFMLHGGSGLPARAARCRGGRWGPGSWKGVHRAGRRIEGGPRAGQPRLYEVSTSDSHGQGQAVGTLALVFNGFGDSGSRVVLVEAFDSAGAEHQARVQQHRARSTVGALGASPEICRWRGE